MSNALESASLIMYPSGYSDGVLGSLKPTDGSGDFTFTRGSNLSATRVGPNGYIEKGYENLLLQSNSFDTTWIRTNATISGGEQGYDGSSDAWLLTGLFGSHALTQNISNSGVATYSLYAKAGTGSGIRIRAIGSTTYTMFVTLTDGTIFSNDGIDGKVIDAGNGWYKYEFTFNTSLTSIQMRITNGATDDFAGTIYIQDAMLNQGLVAYPYIETTTAPVAGGILEDEPRIDFSDGCGHLLLEPQRTNLVPHSEYLNGLAITTMTITPNATTSPEGVDNASLLLATNNAARVTSDHNPVTAGQKINVSAYIKNINCTNLLFYYFDVQNGITIESDNLADELSTEEWRRINYTFTAPQTSSRVQFQFCRIVINGQSLYAYGLQAEQEATYPTSYIPTYGSSSTRLADVYGGDDISSLVGDNQGTLFVEWEENPFLNSASYVDSVGLFQPTGFDRIYISGRALGLRITSTISDNVLYSFSESGSLKMAIKYNGSELILFVNGLEAGTQTQDLTFNPISFGQTSISITTEVKENIKEIILFPTALSDDECIALTS